MNRTPGPARAGARPQRGFALLIVLWALVLLSIVFMHLTAAGRGETEIAGDLRDAAILQARADGLVDHAIFNVMRRSGPRWDADGIAHRLRLPDGMAFVTIDDLGGRIDPNAASVPLLAALIHDVGADAVVSRNLAEAIVAWRSPDAQGAFKAPQYRDAGRPYAPAGAPYTSLDELRLVLGMTPDLYRKLAPELSLYNRDGTTPLHASRIVRQALIDAGVPGDSSARAPRAISISVRIEAPGGRVATRVADVALNVSDRPAGYKILTWRRERR